MRNETIAIHAGYEPDPTTKSVAVPIYQTVAYAFDSADHGAALFNLETEGRIAPIAWKLWIMPSWQTWSTVTPAASSLPA